MLGVVVATLGELERAAPPDVGDLVDLGDLPAVAADVVEHQAFAQRQVAERQLLGAEPAQDRVEEHGAGDDEIGAPRIEAGHGQTLLRIERDDLLAHAANLLGRHAQVAQLGRRRAARGRRGHGAEAEDRARRADHAIEADRRDLIAVPADLRQDVLRELALVAARERIALHEALGQPDHADLEAARRLNRRGVAERDLDAAAADVDDHRARAADVDAVDRGLMNQPRFFGAGDDARTDAGLALDAREELAAVARFARRAGGGGEDLVDAVRFGEPLELRERLQRRVHRLGRQRLAVEAAGAEPDHDFLAIDDLEREVRSHPDDDHVDGVGADVDGGNAHECESDL